MEFLRRTTAEAKTADTPMPAEGETSQPDPTVPNQPTPVKKRSALDAAAKVLGETGQAMNCPELIAAMAAKGYWSSPKGRTPAGTLYSAVLRELKTKGENARFRKTERGKFALRQNV
jgi:HB1, ASXL, restriction endonuclease HTH domain